MNKGFIFDMNGTMIDDMAFHSKAWRSIINDQLHAGLTGEELKEQMYGKNEEVLERVFGKGHFTVEQMKDLSMRKEHAYQLAFKPHLALINGLANFLSLAAQRSIPMAIGTAAIPFNVDFVLNNLGIGHYFKSVITADDVSLSKPHPETFLLGAAAMQVAPANCIVFEDAPKGVEAALNAGMKAVAITTMHGPEDFAQYGNVLFCIKDYTDSHLRQLLD